MSKDAPLTDTARIEQACERARGVLNLRWRVSLYARTVFQGQIDFGSLGDSFWYRKPFDTTTMSKVPVSGLLGVYLYDTFGIEVLLDAALPNGMAILSGDDFEATVVFDHVKVDAQS